MKPVYIDIHIHTSEDPNNINDKYDCNMLVRNVKKIAGENEFILSLSDHNTLNKKAYIELSKLIDHIIMGVELHIKKDEDRPPYHCHMLLNLPISEKNIDEINAILDRLYPDKVIKDDTEDVPTIERISSEFDKYDFLLLPHGGQSHKTFDKSIKVGRRFDTTLERSIYYNQFDGFTARSNSGLDETQEYFKRLGINEFVNLITCTDNYTPSKYPEAKSSDAEAFLPTWMLASPTFDGLRLSLSESTRLVYQQNPPDSWSEYIGRVELANEKINIDVTLTPGLNVVIGGSSSGKSLFVDSLYRKISEDYDECNYSEYGIENLCIHNPSNMLPHYINQNFIVKVLQDKNLDVNQIDIISKVFPDDAIVNDTIRNRIEDFKEHIYKLIDSVREIEQIQNDLGKIPTPNRLIITTSIKQNIISKLMPSESEKDIISFSEVDKERFVKNLDEIADVLKRNPYANDYCNEIYAIKNELLRIADISSFSDKVELVVGTYKKKVDSDLAESNKEGQVKQREREKLVDLVHRYFMNRRIFNNELMHISKYNTSFGTNEIVIQGHTLSIENAFELNPDVVVGLLNQHLINNKRINSFSDIKPETLFKSNYKNRGPKLVDYEKFADLLCKDIDELNKKTYKIITKDNREFETLSPGWKSAVLLDLILGYDQDLAPVIIDQPEDNLATTYINTELIALIKHVKKDKQIILVSHNATIPMLGDAQNIVLCRNDNGKIKIVSSPLEGSIDGKTIVDYIAEITDGGKASIKKRVKKYNLKSFKEV